MDTSGPRKLPNGNLLVPVRLEGPDGMMGDAAEELGPEHPEFSTWLAAMARHARKP